MTARSIAVIAVMLAGLALGSSTALAAAETLPAVTQDGLHLYKQTRDRVVYIKPGATFTQYKQVAILDCYIEFSKDWVKSYNRDQRDLSRKIKDSDLERAKTGLQSAFKKIFTEELEKGGRYKVVDSGGPDVLVLRPGLINIQVSAPDLMSASRSATYIQSAGSMTIYLELLDSASDTLLARVIDASVDPDRYRQRASSVGNRAAAERMMQSWASELRKRLDLVEGGG
ncbi:MAG TPA: DUF3313 family protein [Steroidobacteraceae bacterium]